MEPGYALSSEEHRPLDLVRNAARAEEAGFGFALISDHFHPWVDRQGQSPFVWSVIGAIAVSTETLRLGPGGPCRPRPAAPDPPRDRRPGGGDRGLPHARALLPRRRCRRESERTHPR